MSNETLELERGATQVQDAGEPTCEAADAEPGPGEAEPAHAELGYAEKAWEPSDRGCCYRGDPTTESVPNYLPSPAEIAEMCRRFQAAWSENERWKRAGKSAGRPDAVEIRETRFGR